ncbi:hypothetical protein BUALT_Bualt14G0069900 [Buddleja alternifolia]|uniref:C2 domain-containing protein n=1 Tax=Buddleja alternifolia TaxID=168488 RepID=A0AAV6WQ80_9LAMI|nr:hypothetical protein BUALT_Bualt14G0069900 [Buddleja alternifolia]
MENRTLEITLQYCKDLNKVNLITKMDVYAVVSISGSDNNSKQKTKTPVDHAGDANPTWNFPMKFTVDEAALQNNRLTLDFKLICERALGDKDVGEVNVPIKELFNSPAKGGADGKHIVSYQVRKPSGKPKGQITFSYQFGEKTVNAAAAPPYGAAVPFAPPPGKVDGGPVTAYPAGSSSGYPPHGVYPPPAPYAAEGGGGGAYPPPSGYPAKDGGGVYPPPAGYPAKDGGGVYPPPAGYPQGGGAPPHGGYPHPPPAGYGYPPPPPGYGYPPPPPPGYGYPPQPGYGYPPAAAAAVQKPQKKNKFGMGLGAGLLGGALGGLLIGDMVSDVGDFDCGGGFDF